MYNIMRPQSRHAPAHSLETDGVNDIKYLQHTLLTIIHIIQCVIESGTYYIRVPDSGI